MSSSINTVFGSLTPDRINEGSKKERTTVVEGWYLARVKKAIFEQYKTGAVGITVTYNLIPDISNPNRVLPLPITDRVVFPAEKHTGKGLRFLLEKMQSFTRAFFENSVPAYPTKNEDKQLVFKGEVVEKDQEDVYRAQANQAAVAALSTLIGQHDVTTGPLELSSLVDGLAYVKVGFEKKKDEVTGEIKTDDYPKVAWVSAEPGDSLVTPEQLRG